MTTLYECGPMRRVAEFNFPAFFRVEKNLVAAGFDVINPARRDVDNGFKYEGLTGHEDLSELGFDLKEALLWDLNCVAEADGVAVLPGWRESKGAKAEIAFAQALGKPVKLAGEWVGNTIVNDIRVNVDVYDPPVSAELFRPLVVPQLPVPGQAPPRADVLEEAARLITGDRNNQYGPPTQDFRRTADALTAMGYRRLDTDEQTSLDLVPSDIALMVGMVKISRLMHGRDKRDNWTDLAGYAGCGYECSLEEAK